MHFLHAKPAKLSAALLKNFVIIAVIQDLARPEIVFCSADILRLLVAFSICMAENTTASTISTTALLVLLYRTSIK